MDDTIRINSIFNNARAVKVDTNNHLFVVWKGGVNFHTYNTENLEQITTTSLSDDKGEPVNREKAVSYMEDHLENMRERQDI